MDPTIQYDNIYNEINFIPIMNQKKTPRYIVGKSILNTDQNKINNNEKKILSLLKELNDLKK